MQVDAENDPEPDKVNAKLFRHGRQQRHHDEGNFEEVQEATEDENDDRDDNQEAILSAWQGKKQFFNPDVSVDAVKSQAKDAGTDEDHHDEGRKLRRGIQSVLDRRNGKAALSKSKEQRASRTHSSTFSRGSNAQEDRSKHQKDQCQRWYENNDDLLGEARDQFDIG